MAMAILLSYFPGSFEANDIHEYTHTQMSSGMICGREMEQRKLVFHRIALFVRSFNCLTHILCLHLTHTHTFSHNPKELISQLTKQFAFELTAERKSKK